MSLSQADAHRIIAEGDIELLVDTARSVGDEASRQLTTSQIRGIFGEVRQIEMTWPVDLVDAVSRNAAMKAYRRVVLLQPKLAYQAKRERGAGVEILKDTLDPCIQEIRNADEAQRRDFFLRFVDFFEAILAYHKAAGGN